MNWANQSHGLVKYHHYIVMYYACMCPCLYFQYHQDNGSMSFLRCGVNNNNNKILTIRVCGGQMRNGYALVFTDEEYH